MRFRSRGRRSFRGRARPAMHWVPAPLWGTPTAIAALPSTTTAGLILSTAQASVGFIDNNSATLYRVRGQLMLWQNVAAGNICSIQGGLIEVPVTGGATPALDAADFSPEIFNNATKKWLWMFSVFVGKNASGFGPEFLTLEVDVKSKRRIVESGIALVMRSTAVVGAANAPNFMPNIRALVGRLG